MARGTHDLAGITPVLAEGDTSVLGLEKHPCSSQRVPYPGWGGTPSWLWEYPVLAEGTPVIRRPLYAGGNQEIYMRVQKRNMAKYSNRSRGGVEKRKVKTKQRFCLSSNNKRIDRYQNNLPLLFSTPRYYYDASCDHKIEHTRNKLSMLDPATKPA